MTRWLVVIEDDLEPRLEGPFKSDLRRVVAAREHRKKDFDRRDGLFQLDITASGIPRMHSFISREISSQIDQS
jgi:hypothetical protein